MFRFFYKKGAEPLTENLFRCNSVITANNMAHEILRGFYAASQQMANGDLGMIYLNSKGDMVGCLVVDSQENP